MTEKTAVYQDDKLIGYCDRVSLRTELQSFGEPDENCYRITGFVPIDHQPAFAVGEYYADHHAIYKITAENKVTAFVFRNKKLNDKLSLDVLINTPLSPATAEQIAMFKRAEIKREIGLIIKKGDADWIEIVEDIEEYLAEELQEVGKNTPKIRNKLNDPFHVTKRQVNVDWMVIADD